MFRTQERSEPFGQEVNSKPILVIRVYFVARRENPVLRVVFLCIEAYNRYYTDYHKPCFPLLTILTHLCCSFFSTCCYITMPS